MASISPAERARRASRELAAKASIAIAVRAAILNTESLRYEPRQKRRRVGNVATDHHLARMHQAVEAPVVEAQTAQVIEALAAQTFR